MTTQGSFTTTIAAAPQAVWAWVGALERHGEWSPKPYRVELVSGEANQVGARYRSVGWVPGDASHSNDVEITEAVPAQRLALKASDEQGVYENSYTLRPVADGTEVTYHVVFPAMTGVAAVVVPVLFPLLGKPDMRKRMKLLKARVEAGA